MDCPIFISYSRKDTAIVHPLVKEIEAQTGIKCWIDLNGIESGDLFEEKIICAIEKADIVIFMLSENSLGSPYVQKEVRFAETRHKRLVCAIIDNMMIEEMPSWFIFNHSGDDIININDSVQKTKLINNIRNWTKQIDESKKNVVEKVKTATKPALNPVAKIKLNNFIKNIEKNDVNALSTQLSNVEILENKFSSEELAFNYYLVLSALHAEKYEQMFLQSNHESYWCDFWSAIALAKLSKTDEATNALMSLDDLHKDYPSDNTTLLGAASSFIKGDYEDAKEMLDAVTGEFSKILQPLAESLICILHPTKAKEMDMKAEKCAFYIVNIFNQEDPFEKAERERLAKEEAERKAKERAERKAQEDDITKVIDMVLDNFREDSKINNAKGEYNKDNDAEVAPDHKSPDTEYVDLGTSVLWATCNLGAHSPEDYGDFFAWGETETKNAELFTKQNYKLGQPQDSYMRIDKYNNSDYLLMLQPCDDAATQILGEGWSIPSVFNFKELERICEFKRIQVSDKWGYLCTSKVNQNTIFLPCAGYIKNGGRRDVNNEVHYWTSTKENLENEANWWNLRGNASTQSYTRDRWNGFSIRPVKRKQ